MSGIPWLNPDGPQAATRPPALATSEIRPLRILVAEDNPINQKITAKLLQRAGHSVEVANDGREALAIWREQPFDLILMDIQMPEMDGLEATRIIRSGNGPQPVIIAMTANVMVGDKDECLEEGMNDYLAKPVNLDQLVSMLKKWGGMINAN